MDRPAGSFPFTQSRAARAATSQRARTPVVLLDATYGLGFQAIPALAHAGNYDVLALSLIDDRPIFQRSRYCRYRHEPNWCWQRGPEQLAAPRNGGAILFPVTQAAVSWVTRHHDELSRSWLLPPANRFDTLRIASDKVTFADFVRSIGLNAPRTVTLPCASKILDELHYPVLLKPRTGAGGRGIRSFENRTALAARLLALTPAERDDLYLQEYVEGEDISCGIFSQHGEIHREVAYSCLARDSKYGAFKVIQCIQDGEISRTISALVRALNWNGVANIDFRRSPDGDLNLLELNPRLWGNTLGALSWGLNFPDMLCQAALGEHLPSHQLSPGVYFGTTECLGLLPELFNLARNSDTKPLLAARHSSLRFVLRDPVAHWMIFRDKREESVWASLRRLFGLGSH